MVERRVIVCRDIDDNDIDLSQADMVFDGKKCVLISDRINNTVHVLSTTGEYRRRLLSESDGLCRPTCLALNTQRRLLYVSMNTSDVKEFVLDGRWDYRLDVTV